MKGLSFKQFCWEHTGILPKCVIVDNIKRNFSLSNWQSSVYVNNVSNIVRYFFFQISVIFENLLKSSLKILLQNSHIHFTFLSSHHWHLNSHATFYQICSISLSTLPLFFSIRPLICFACRALMNYVCCMELKQLITNLFLKVLAVVTWRVSTPCARTNPKRHWKRSNLQFISYNSGWFLRSKKKINPQWLVVPLAEQIQGEGRICILLSRRQLEL
jgi:hypothetical protein